MSQLIVASVVPARYTRCAKNTLELSNGLRNRRVVQLQTFGLSSLGKCRACSNAVAADIELGYNPSYRRIAEEAVNRKWRET